MPAQNVLHMKFNTVLLAVLVTAFSATAFDLSAQVRSTRSSKKEEKEEKTFKERLWYGGGFSLGFASGAFSTGNVFGIGLSPMVGYKIAGPVSVGPRLEVQFLSVKVPGVKAQGFWNYETGIFARAKVYRGFFLHGEVGSEWEQQGDKSYRSYLNPYFGAGYNWGQGGGGSEIALLYNFRIANDIQTSQLPIDYRFAITWGF